MEQLTEKQAKILTFLGEIIEERGHAPSFAEICEHFGFASVNAAQAHLAALEKKGAIIRHPNIARGIKIVDRRPDLEGAWFAYTGLSHTRPTMDFEAGFRVGRTGKITK